MKVVTEHRAELRKISLQVVLESNGMTVPHVWPLGHVAVVISCSGISTLQAGHTSFSSFDTGDGLLVRPCTSAARSCPSCDKSGGLPGRRDWTAILNTNGTSLAMGGG